MFDYYESLGVLEVTPTTLPATQPNDPALSHMFVYEHSPGDDKQTWRTEKISINDCFLKNMNIYKYIVNIDIDEVIVPTKETGPTWLEMMEVLEDVTENEACGKNAPRSSYIVTTVFSLLEIGDFGTLGSWMI